MTIKELLEQLKTIQQERTLAAHHDDMFFTTYEDVEALDRVIGLIKVLDESDPDDSVKIGELLAASNIKR